MAKDELMQKLKEAREARQVTIQDASRVLSIRPQVLQDLEEGRYERLGALLYIKSYTRKYAGYLKMDMAEVDELLSQLQDPFKQAQTESLIRAQLNEEKRMVHRSFFKWYMAIILALLVAGIGGYFIYGDKVTDIFHIKSPSDQTVKIPESEAVMISELDVTSSDEKSDDQEDTTTAEMSEPSVVETKAEDVVITNNNIDTQATLSNFHLDQIIQSGDDQQLEDIGEVEQIEESSVPTPAEGMSIVSITLNDGECWLQIKDKNQKILMNEVLPANATYHVEGAAPFSLHMGNARSIDKLLLNGQEVEQKLYRPTPRTTVSKIKLEPKEES